MGSSGEGERAEMDVMEREPGRLEWLLLTPMMAYFTLRLLNGKPAMPRWLVWLAAHLP